MAPAATDLPEDVETRLRAVGLTRLWAKARKRLESNGIAASGAFYLDDITDAERYDLSGLLGRSITTHRTKIDLAHLDERLRTGPTARGLAAVLEALDGPLVDRKTINTTSSAERTELWSAAREAVVAHGLAERPWCEAWLAALRRRGVLAGLDHADAVRTVQAAVRCCAALPRLEPSAGPGAEVARNDLAVQVSGSAHGLDDGKPLPVAVLLAVAAARDIDLPKVSSGRRLLWHDAGVLTDQVSDTVLTLGLAPVGDDPRSADLRNRAAESVETHLNARDVRRVRWELPPGTVVSICENPRVVEAAADAGVVAPLVCTSGNPRLVVTELLGRLAAAGATFRYHGDFDWPGLAIAVRVMSRVNAAPWLFGASDYLAAVHAGNADVPFPGLEGDEVLSPWDPELSEAMRRSGVAVHEEAVLDGLVASLLTRDR